MTEAEAEPARRSPVEEDRRRRAMVRDAARYACIAGALVCALVAALGWPQLAISIGLGTLLGAINFVLLARSISGAIDRTVAEVERTKHERGEAGGDPDAGLEPEEVVGRPYSAGGVLRMIFALALLAGLLSFPPTEPMGLAIGVIIVLIAASVAAYRHERGNAGGGGGAAGGDPS